MEDLNQNQNSNKPAIITLSIVAGVLLIALIILGVFSFSRVKELQQENRELAEYISDNFSLDVADEDAETVEVSEEEVEDLSRLPEGPKLVKNTDDGEELVFLFNNRYDDILKWNNWLLSGDKNYGTEDSKARVRAYNLETGESKIIFDLANRDELGGDATGRMQYVNELVEMDGVLFISFGGYMMPGGIYYLELSEDLDNEVEFLSKISNPTIKKANQGYVITGGEGDACWLRLEYYTATKELKRLAKVLVAEDGCGDGQRVIKQDGADLIIGEVKKQGEDWDTSVYTEIYTQNLFNSQGVGSLINDSLMPENIKSVGYSDNSLFLMGEDWYQFDLDAKKLEKLFNVEEFLTKAGDDFKEVRLYEYINDENVVCVNRNYEYNLDTEVLEKKEDPCYEKEEGYSSKTVETLIKDLELSEEYYYKN